MKLKGAKDLGIISKKGLVGCTVAILILTCTSCGNLTGKQERVPRLLADREISFMTEKVIKKDIENEILVDGRVFSSKEQKMSFKKSGKLMTYDVYMGKKVKKGDVLATIDVSEIQHKMIIAKLRIEQAELGVKLANKSGDLDKIRNAEIDLRIQKLELDKLSEYLNNSSLIVEIDGIIASYSGKSIGSMVTPGITMVKILETKDLGIRFQLNDVQLENVNVGDSVDLIIEGEKHSTEVTEIMGNNVIAMMPKDLDGRLQVSSKIQVHKALDSIKGALLVPKIGVYTDVNKKSSVQVLEEGKMTTKIVRLGIEVGSYVQVLEGIEEGEEILVK